MRYFTNMHDMRYHAKRLHLIAAVALTDGLNIKRSYQLRQLNAFLSAFFPTSAASIHLQLGL